MLKAVPPKGKISDAACSTARSRSCGTASTSSASPSPRSASRASNQIVIQLAGVHDASKAARADRQDRPARVLRPRGRPDRPVQQRRPGRPRRGEPLQAAHGGQQADAKTGDADRVLPVQQEEGSSSPGPSDTRREAARHAPSSKPASSRRARRFFAVPEKTTVISLRCEQPAVPGFSRPTRRRPPCYYLFKYDPENATKPVPEMTGGDLKLSGTRAGLRPRRTGQPSCCSASRGRGREKFHEITRDEATRGAARSCGRLSGSDQATIRQFAQHFAIVLDREIKSSPYDRLQPSTRTGSTRHQRRPDHGHQRHSARRRTSRSSSRPARCRSSSSRSSAPTSRRRSARTRSRRRRRRR